MNTAKSHALASISRTIGHAREDVLIIDEMTQCRRIGWIFFYEARAYLETGDATKAIGKTGPVVVTHDGDVQHLDGEQPVAFVLAAFEKSLRRRRMLR